MEFIFNGHSAESGIYRIERQAKALALSIEGTPHLAV
jgi:hypothetical protein